MKTAIEELQDYPQWVGWRAKPKDNGRTDKIPINPHTGKNASSTDPKTWGTCDEAKAAFKKFKLSGVGFVLTNRDPFIGIDIDDCRNLDTGILTPQADAWVDKFHSYTEVTPSKSGLRIWIKGKAPGKRQKGEGIEIYSTGRFLTVTGNHVEGTPLTSDFQQPALDAVYKACFGEDKSMVPPQELYLKDTPETLTDQEILSKARQAKNKDKFEKLYQGNVEGYQSDSEADLALCNMLAFWTQNRNQVDRLFRESDLIRPKWNEKRGDSTYGWQTIDKALANVTETYTPGNGKLRIAEHGLPTEDVPWACNADDTEITTTSAPLDDVSGIEIGLAQRVRNWISTTEGEFLTRDVFDVLNIEPGRKATVSKILSRLVDEKLIERTGKRTGCFRRIENELVRMNIFKSQKETVNIKLPFGINDMVKIMPGNIIVVAGSKDAGKTAFLFNVAKDNIDTFNIHYFNSEMGEDELDTRLGLFEDTPPEIWNKVNFYERDHDFHDVIVSGKGNVNIVDYLEIYEDFWLTRKLIAEIWKKLDGAIAIVGLQKPRNRDTGIGGEGTLEKARLYLSMDSGKIKILKAKNWKGGQNPNGKEIQFKIVGGCKLIQVDNWSLE